MRELSDEDVCNQAAALEEYVNRGGVPLRWFASKWFEPEDSRLILRQWNALQAQREPEQRG